MQVEQLTASNTRRDNGRFTPGNTIGAEHRFKKGRSGNPNGRPRRLIMSNVLTRYLTMDDGIVARELVKAAIEMAKRDAGFFREIMNRVDGPAQPPVEEGETGKRVNGEKAAVAPENTPDASHIGADPRDWGRNPGWREEEWAQEEYSKRASAPGAPDDSPCTCSACMAQTGGYEEGERGKLGNGEPEPKRADTPTQRMEPSPCFTPVTRGGNR